MFSLDVYARKNKTIASGHENTKITDSTFTLALLDWNCSIFRKKQCYNVM